MTVSKFKVGDSVFSPSFGEGIVTGIEDNKLAIYPVHVKWVKKLQEGQRDEDIFTPEGLYNVSLKDPEYDICFLKQGQFKVGDHVISRRFGRGVVEHISDNANYQYPITVKWEIVRDFASYDSFTKDGQFTSSYPDPEYDIILEGEEEGDEEEMGQIAGVIDHNIHNNIAPWGDYFKDKEDKKGSATDEKFKVGDRVYSPFSGVGEIIKIGANANLEYPIRVHWLEKKDINTFDNDFFTLAGTFYSDRRDTNRDIVPVEDVDLEEKDEGTVERMEDALNKRVEDAVNPAHYKVKGLPEAIDIINHLMHRCQLEGFFWGNILKYAYRYGKKGDKAETAGKIEWYAKQLKELCECEEEERGKNDSEGTHGVGEEE